MTDRKREPLPEILGGPPDPNVLQFGRHMGKTIDEVAEKDPGYLIWAHENVGRFKLPDDLYQALLRDEAETDTGLSAVDFTAEP